MAVCSQTVSSERRGVMVMKVAKWLSAITLIIATTISIIQLPKNEEFHETTVFTMEDGTEIEATTIGGAAIFSSKGGRIQVNVDGLITANAIGNFRGCRYNLRFDSVISKNIFDPNPCSYKELFAVLESLLQDLGSKGVDLDKMRANISFQRFLEFITPR